MVLGPGCAATPDRTDDPATLDEWNTSTYQNFSSLYGQIGFCQVAGDVAKHALAQPKGQLFEIARTRIREMRSALRPSGDRLFSD